MSHNILLLVVLNALPNQTLKPLTSNLSDNEANLMLEQTRLGLKVLFGQKPGKCFPALHSIEIPHVIHGSVFMEKRDLLAK